MGPKKALNWSYDSTMLFLAYVSYPIELGDVSYVIFGAYYCQKVYDKYSNSV